MSSFQKDFRGRVRGVMVLGLVMVFAVVGLSVSFDGEVYAVEPADGGSSVHIDAPQSDDANCSSILPPSWCSEDSDEGIWNILQLILVIMTAGVGVLATIGLVISGIQWLTARDKEDQIVKAKSRIFNIVIGIVVWGLMWLFLSWLIPGGIL